MLSVKVLPDYQSLIFPIRKRAMGWKIPHVKKKSPRPRPPRNSADAAPRRSIKHGNAAPPECGHVDIVRRWAVLQNDVVVLWERIGSTVG